MASPRSLLSRSMKLSSSNTFILTSITSVRSMRFFSVPLWMAIIIGVAVGLICLLLLICLLGLCLRLFG